MFEICTGSDMSAFLLIGINGMNESKLIKKHSDVWNIIQSSKQLLYQDSIVFLI